MAWPGATLTSRRVSAGALWLEGLEVTSGIFGICCRCVATVSFCFCLCTGAGEVDATEAKVGGRFGSVTVGLVVKIYVYICLYLAICGVAMKV